MLFADIPCRNYKCMEQLHGHIVFSSFAILFVDHLEWFGLFFAHFTHLLVFHPIYLDYVFGSLKCKGVYNIRILNILFRYIVFLISLWLVRPAVGWASHNEIRLIWETTYGIYAKVRQKKMRLRDRGRGRRATKIIQCVSVSVTMYMFVHTTHTRNTDCKWKENYMK